MIKAEAITHEGNPGPNWLDRCRNAVTPTKVTIIIVTITAAALFVGLTNRQSTSVETANQQSSSASTTQQSIPADANSLQVEPLQPTTDSSTDASVQPTSTNDMPTSSTPSTSGQTSNPGSATQSTPAQTPATSQLQGFIDQRKAKAQSHVESLQTQLQNTQNSINKALGGLGL